MREYRIPILVLLLFFPASAQTIPAGWKVVKDSKNTCQIAVPPEWVLLDFGTPLAGIQITPYGNDSLRGMAPAEIQAALRPDILPSPSPTNQKLGAALC